MWRYLGIFLVLFLIISTSSSENDEVISQAQMKCETMCNERQNTSAILWKLYKHINRLEGQSEVTFITALNESKIINNYLECAICQIEYLQSVNEVKISTYRSYLEKHLKIPLLKLQKTVDTINTTRFNGLKNGDLETQLQIKEIKLANLTNEIEECSSQLHDLYYNITVRDNQINDLKAQINKTALELKQLDELRNKTLQNNAALRDKDNEIANLKVELKKLQAKPAKQEKCQSEITACQKKTTNLDAEIKTKIKEIDDLKSRNDKSLGECQAERNEVNKRAEDTLKNLEYCNKTLNALKIESTGRDKQLKKLDEQKNTLANCQREFAALNATLKTYNDDKRWLKIYKEDYNRAVSQLRDREGELHKCTQDRDQYQSDLTECNKKFEEKDREFNKTQPFINSFNAIISELSHKDKELTSCTEEKDKYKLDSDSSTENHKNCLASLVYMKNLHNNLNANFTQKIRELNKCKSESKQLQPANTSCHDQIKQFDDARNKCTRILADKKIKLRDCESKLQKPLTQPRLPTLAQTVTPPQQRSCQNSNGIISIRLPSNDEFPVLCTHNVMGSGWIMILNRFDGSLNFTLPWKEYRNGFGDLSGEFFLGLQKIYLITNSQPHELYIKLIDENNYQYYGSYDNFQIGNEGSLFKLESVGHFYNNNVGDALSYSINSVFLTYVWDKRQCAYKSGGGWWYTVDNCRGGGNLHGNYDGNFEWYDALRERYIKLKSVRMMIRPKSTTSSYG